MLKPSALLLVLSVLSLFFLCPIGSAEATLEQLAVAEAQLHCAKEIEAPMTYSVTGSLQDITDLISDVSYHFEQRLADVTWAKQNSLPKKAGCSWYFLQRQEIQWTLEPKLPTSNPSCIVQYNFFNRRDFNNFTYRDCIRQVSDYMSDFLNPKLNRAFLRACPASNPKRFALMSRLDAYCSETDALNDPTHGLARGGVYSFCCKNDPNGIKTYQVKLTGRLPLRYRRAVAPWD